MRVLRPLIALFWQRGVLTPEQAHYFVEHGFVRPEDLPDYQPRPPAEEVDDGADKSGRARRRRSRRRGPGPRCRGRWT